MTTALKQEPTEPIEGTAPVLAAPEAKPVVVARLWSRYVAGVPSYAPIVLGLNGGRYRTVCIYLKHSSQEPDYFATQGLTVHFVSRLQYFRVFHVPAVWRLVQLLRAERVDILHCHLHQSTVYGTIAARIAGVPVVISHVHGIHRTARRRRRWINRLILPHVSRILTVGEATRQDVLRTNPVTRPEQVVSVGNSIDGDYFLAYDVCRDEARRRLGIDRDAIVYSSVGRLAPNKNYGRLVEAFAHLKKEIGKALLIIAGEGPLREDLTRQARALGVYDSVRLLGYVQDVRPCLRATDVFVLPTLADGLPRSLLEAMAMGVLCVGSSASGVPEILGYGSHGWIVDATCANELVTAMRQAARMPQAQRTQRLAAARQHVMEHYNHQVVIERIRDIYETELAKVHAHRG